MYSKYKFSEQHFPMEVQYHVVIKSTTNLGSTCNLFYCATFQGSRIIEPGSINNVLLRSPCLHFKFGTNAETKPSTCTNIHVSHFMHTILHPLVVWVFMSCIPESSD